MTLAWVLGGRGLLGSALCRALSARGETLFAPTMKFSWDEPAKLSSQIESAVQEFSAAALQASSWEIYWAAGVGTMASTDDLLAPETAALQKLLNEIAADRQLSAQTGSIAFSSSAGAVYASCADEVITEASLPAPNSAYGRAKLRQEAVVREFGDLNPRVTVLLARISTLYGVGQATGKQQGLLAHMARSIIRNKPIGIFVPIDTIRDYISADDASEEIIETLREFRGTPGALVKIVASGRPVTIAEIISIFKRITRKSPRITTSASRASSLYLRRIQFRSIVSDSRPPKIRSLSVGVAQLFSAERFSHANPVRRQVTPSPTLGSNIQGRR